METSLDKRSDPTTKEKCGISPQKAFFESSKFEELLSSLVSKLYYIGIITSVTKLNGSSGFFPNCVGDRYETETAFLRSRLLLGCGWGKGVPLDPFRSLTCFQCKSTMLTFWYASENWGRGTMLQWLCSHLSEQFQLKGNKFILAVTPLQALSLSLLLFNNHTEIARSDFG